MSDPEEHPKWGSKDWVEARKNGGKEVLFVNHFADVFIAMLRAARSPHAPQYRASAAASFDQWLDILGRGPSTSVKELIDSAVERIGFRDEPEDKFDQQLVRIARAGITYLIEAGKVGTIGSGLLSRRTEEFRRAIEGYNEMRQERRQHLERPRE